MTAHNAPAGADWVAMLPRLRRYARVLTGTLRQADALVVATLSCAQETYGMKPQQTPLHTWLLTIMRELHADAPSPQSPAAMTRREGVAAKSGDAWQLAASGPPPGGNATGDVLRRLARLPLEEREVLVLVAVEGLPYAEIATLLRVSIATVMSRLHCARETIHALASESPSAPNAGKEPI